MTADAHPSKPDADLEPGGELAPGATPPDSGSTSMLSDGKQAVPKRFSPTIITVGIITAIIILVAIAGGIAVIFDAFQFFN